ncbi:MAG: hypothetical protein LR015_12220 [Verrucomicrobia bacterium]|nr:hypothetical protein [Verrucomicrobiota bacterium]
MARLQFDSRELGDLVRKGLLRTNEVTKLNESYDFLIRVRNELHLENKRATDLLNLEKQPSVAWHLGYRQEDIFKRVELFMRDYYQRTQW